MDKNGKNDVFAQIALQRIQYRDSNLVIPGPPELPDKFLPCQKNDSSAKFSPTKKIKTKEELDALLQECRKDHKKFTQNLAPKLPQIRQQIPLTTFDWRIETEQDQQDFSSVLKGEGNWQQVNIPHYGEPLGLAATYYRTTFKITQKQLDTGCAFIHFKAVDYKAHVFINGAYLGSHEGFFAPFEFDLTSHARIGDNTLVVKVENDFIFGSNKSWDQAYSGDKLYAATGLGYDDPNIGWHHCPPGMGIYQDVYVDFRPRTFISDIYVRPLPEKKSAQAWIEVYSCDIDFKKITLEFSLFGKNFKETIFKNQTYEPNCINISGLNDDLNIAFAKANGTYNKPIGLSVEKGTNNFVIPFEIPSFRWWNHETPWLYELQVRLLNEKEEVTDVCPQHFGMRSFSMDENSDPKGALLMNNRPIRLRGANTMGYMQQSVFKKDFDQLVDDILLAKICNMNFLRLTQRPVQPEIYEYCDMLGMMTQTDLPLFGCIRQNKYCEALKQVEEMEKLVRSHPCNIMASYINEPFPNSSNKPHRNISRKEMENFFRAADDIIHRQNPDRVIKPCDGDYDPPAPGIQDRHCYTTWYNGQGVELGSLMRGYWQPTKKDWYYGCGEFGAEGLESADIMQKYYPQNWLPQTPDEEKTWSPSSIVKAQTGNFHFFFYDTQQSLKDWIEASQEHQRWSIRTLTEAFRRDNRMISFAIHLFIDAFPSGWMKTIMDFKRNPKKAFFAYRDALEPLLPTIRSDRFKFHTGEEMKFEAWISNDLPEVPKNCTVHYQLEQDGQVLFCQKAKADIEPAFSTFQGYVKFEAPSVEERTAMTLRIAVIDEQSNVLNDNWIDIEIFPALCIEPPQVYIIGKAGIAEKLAEEIGAEICPLAEAKTILVDDYQEYQSRKNAVDQSVENGATAVFLEMNKDGAYQIGDGKIEVKTSRFNPLHFVSRKTSHPLVENMHWDDFRLWYAPGEDRIKPIIEATFETDDFTPVLTSGNADNQARWHKTLAVGERKYAKGRFYVCQVQLAGRLETNPTAKLFTLRLLGLTTVKKAMDQPVSTST